MAARKLATRFEASLRLDLGQPGRRDLRGGRYRTRLAAGGGRTERGDRADQCTHTGLL